MPLRCRYLKITPRHVDTLRRFVLLRFAAFFAEVHCCRYFATLLLRRVTLVLTYGHSDTEARDDAGAADAGAMAGNIRHNTYDEDV